MFLKITNGNPEKYTIGDLRRDNPQVSFPKYISNETLAEFKVYPYYRGEIPTYDKLTSYLKEGGFKRDDSANWYLSYTFENLSQGDAERNVRAKRDQLLKDSDWTQVSDVPVDKTAWATYRKALRDITKQEGFPFNVTWPESP